MSRQISPLCNIKLTLYNYIVLYKQAYFKMNIWMKYFGHESNRWRK
jgi:hypothetical protein